MKPEGEYQTKGLPGEWGDAVVEMLETRGLNVKLYRSRTVRERFLDALASPNIDVLVRAGMRKERLNKVELMSGLGIDERTVQRWVAGEVIVHPRTFHAVLYILLCREIHEFDFVDSKAAIEEAMCFTLRVIRMDIYGEAPRRPRRDEFILLRQLLRHPQGKQFIQGLQPGDVDVASCDRSEILEQVIHKCRSYTSGPSVSSTEAASASIKDWALAYAALRFGLPLEISSILEIYDEKPR